MTRLTTHDVTGIAGDLGRYDARLKSATGSGLFETACHAWQADPDTMLSRIRALSVQVIPVTAGLGVIGDFSATVCAILRFLGIHADVSSRTDVDGLAFAFESGLDAVMMADDNRFAGIHLRTGQVADNDECTGKVFAAALELSAGTLAGLPVLVLGCGPVGAAAAQRLLTAGAKVLLFDTRAAAATLLESQLEAQFGTSRVQAVSDLSRHGRQCRYFLEATPAQGTIQDAWLSRHTHVAAPGVPLGVSEKGIKLMGRRLIHDKLALGVAAMAVRLVKKQGEEDDIPQME